MNNDSMKTRKFRKPFIFDSEILISKAYRDLKHSSVRILIELHRRITITNDGNFRVANNGKIHLTYKSVKGLFNMSAGTYNSAIDDLHEHGFIQITHAGSGCQGDKTLIMLTNNWKHYGRDSFVPCVRKKSNRTSKGKPMGGGNI